MVDRTNFMASQRPYMTTELYPPNKGEILTIRDIQEVSITPKAGSQPFKKLQLWWKEDRPPLDLNQSMLAFLIGTFGQDDDQWVRQKVYVWHDPTIITKRGRGALCLDTAYPSPPSPLPGSGPDADLRRELNKQQQETAKQELDDDIPF